MNSGIDMQSNIDSMTCAIAEAKNQDAKFYFAPEMSVYLDRDRIRAAHNILSEKQHPALKQLQNAAKSHDMMLHIGSMPIRNNLSSVNDPPYANRSYIIDNHGRIIAQYDKIHLFDITLSNGEAWRESNAYKAGSKAVITQTVCGSIGLSICYDLRFAALYNILSEAGADITAVPAAFTVPTGKAHWHVLLRARAIENAMFIVAAAQCGHHQDGRQTYGHSLVVDPWGEVLLDMGQEIGLGYAEIDLRKIAEVRAQLPVIDHRRPIDSIEDDRADF